ncbi:hypothetical protein [Vibrio apostichopi]|uniref:hypothetical protein n=1 Tax=Vibrio apostichopi TaxID=3035453 RepID=UPI0025736C6A|nr:hypothetical protein [Vibrio sp. FE10]
MMKWLGQFVEWLAINYLVRLLMILITLKLAVFCFMKLRKQGYLDGILGARNNVEPS